jgi:hypothetical protein
MRRPVTQAPTNSDHSPIERPLLSGPWNRSALKEMQ